MQLTHSQLQRVKRKTSPLFVLILLFVSASECQQTRNLPSAFAFILPQVKAKSQKVPLLLPSDLPNPISNAKQAVVDKAAANEYSVILFYDLDAGNTGFAAMFSGDAATSYNPRELPKYSRSETRSWAPRVLQTH